MATKKITLNEIRDIVKEVISELEIIEDLNKSNRDENVRSDELRPLTPEEYNQVIKSAESLDRTDRYFDFSQDSSLRYISNYGQGYEYWTVVNKNTLHKIKVPVDSHIANVIGNMNYTDAYKKGEEDRRGGR